jgi:hypothetical protein
MQPKQVSYLILIFLFIIILLYGMLLTQNLESWDSIERPGVTWKIKYSDHPELNAIYEKYKESCVIPQIPTAYFSEIITNTTYQQMRNDCRFITNENIETKYEDFETQKSREWFDDVSILNTDPLLKIRHKDYNSRIGCFIRNIPLELEAFAKDKINELMKRLNLPNRLKRLSDSRGATYMPEGGCMELHSNRDHYGGWRLYMHVVNTEKGKSWFSYRHPFDKSVRIIQDENERANLFRIRKLPNELLWHSIWSNTDRFSWGIWLPPELAHALKGDNDRI